MKYNYCLKFILLLLIISGCIKDESISTSDLLQNEKGWYSYEYKRVDIGESAQFKVGQPYIIIGEYGSGVKIKEDGVCHFNYSDGIKAINEGTVTRKWEMNGNNEIIFTKQSSENINVKIVEITNDFLWIMYEQSGDNYEYKLRKIE